jgi:hypothetical protein
MQKKPAALHDLYHGDERLRKQERSEKEDLSEGLLSFIISTT